MTPLRGCFLMEAPEEEPMTEREEKVVILVADDEPSTLALVSSHVRSLGYKVLEASDGDQAWQLAHENLPDLVVLDVMMPGMSGWEVCRKIREAVSLAHTGVIMLTGIGENLNEMTSPLYGADQYIDKPFEFADLDEKIRTTLEERKNGAMGRPHPESDVPSSELESTAHVSTGNGLVKVPRTRAKKKEPAGEVAPEVETASPKPRAKAKPFKRAKAPEAKAAAATTKSAAKKASKAKAAPVEKSKATKKVAAKAASVEKAKATKKVAAKAAPVASVAQAKATKKAPTAKAAPKKAPKKAAAKKAVAAKAAPAKAASKKPPKKAAKAVAAKAAPVKAASKKASAKKVVPPAKSAAKAAPAPKPKAKATEKSEAPPRARRGATPATLN